MATRRDFFKETGLLIGFSLADTAILPRLMTAAETVPALPSPTRLDAWLRVRSDETIQVFTGKVDIGMGVGTALRQIVAEELDVTPGRISFVMGDTALTPDQGGVGGSTSISQGARPLRNAAASARFALLQLASARLGTTADRLQVKDGVVSVTGDTAKTVSYGTLVGTQPGGDLNGTLKVSGNGFAINVEGSGKPKDPASYTVVGQSIPRPDLTLKITGRAIYATDIRVPGMLHGRVIRPAAAGSTFVSVDDTAAKKIPGFRTTVVRGNFVGVVAENEWGAIRAAREVKVTWSPSKASLPADVYQYMRSAAAKTTREGQKKGDVAAALSAAVKKIEASYEWPFQAHATMGPGCAVADVQADGVTTVWCGGQKPHSLQQGIAEMLKVANDRVRVIWVEDAGSYGRAGYEDAAGDAVLLSQAVGKPVRVQWMRADMTAWGGKGPAAVVDLVAGLDAQGEVSALQCSSRAFSGTEIQPQPSTAGNLLAAQLNGVANTMIGDEFVQWGDNTRAYTFANTLSTAHVVPAFDYLASPLRTTHLRDPNGPAGTFAGESFMDEIAAAAGADPIEFRMKYLTDARAKAALNAVIEHAKWEKRPSPKRSGPNGDLLTGRGMALALRGGTHVATVAEVEVNRKTGAVRVTRLVCAHDCGLIVNPDGLRATISANLIQSMSRALKEEVTFDRDQVTSVDWNTYPIARAKDIPEIEIVLLNHPEVPPSGAGEPSSRPTAAAISNAIFDATGVRLRRVPMIPERVKAGLGKLQTA